MNEPTEIKYSLDENGEPYFAATHIQAVKGLEFDNDEDLISIINQMKNEIESLIESLVKQDDIIAGYEDRITNLEKGL
ncbi:hypothetical protein [Staphylococcus equorum]|uniref:hypothetical protein n=1 Tax=Staphylococcus equorum TaxID=246432 RepID=UPI0025521631|nr:hypothetical protein [Staphylococcus equorum]MDK9870210.1 hypothetical protein [Staphylococcus equorum]